MDDTGVHEVPEASLPWEHTFTTSKFGLYKVLADNKGVQYSLTIDGKEVCTGDDKKFPAECACGGSQPACF